MDFELPPEAAEYRKQIVAFLDENLNDAVFEGGNGGYQNTPARREFVSKMADKGWLSQGWPQEYGGTSKTADPVFLYILNEQLQLRGLAAVIARNVGAIGQTILHHATESVKKEILPKILKNQIQWAIAYTEPEAGSDLANMSVRAEEDGDYFVLNGVKRFITGSHICDYFWTAVRTDPNLPKHKGISLLIMDATLPGITVRPLFMIGGERTNELYLDNVRVHKDYLVGEKNRGWYYIAEALDYERYIMISFQPHIREFSDFVEWIQDADLGGRKPKNEAVARHRMARMAARIAAGWVIDARATAQALNNKVPGNEAAMNKHWGAQVIYDLADMQMDIMGPYGYLKPGSYKAPLDGQSFISYVGGGHLRVAAGGVNIAKGIIAKRMLRLPL